MVRCGTVNFHSYVNYLNFWNGRLYHVLKYRIVSYGEFSEIILLVSGMDSQK